MSAGMRRNSSSTEDGVWDVKAATEPWIPKAKARQGNMPQSGHLCVGAGAGKREDITNMCFGSLEKYHGCHTLPDC